MHPSSFFAARHGISSIWLGAVLTLLFLCWAPPQVAAQVTLLIPSQPSLEAPSADAPSPSASEPLNLEVDVLITMMRPFQHQGLGMDMPQLFAVLRYDEDTPSVGGVLQPERQDLLGDVEEIRYLEQKAWGANVALNRPGLHHVLMEARPWWDEQRGRFIQQYCKVTLPVHGIARGWNLATGQRLEILPLTRPFGLTAPAIFSARAVQDNAPLAGAPIRMHRINTDKQQVPSPWHQELAARADANGQFSFVLHQPGWWCCQATVEGAPLKGPDGQPKPLEMSALFWLYVDAPLPPRPSQPEKNKR